MPERKNTDLFEQLHHLTTEQRNPETMNIDARSVEEILKTINGEDKKVALAVEHEIPHIAIAVDLVVAALKNNGRLIYVGAGTSGRLGVLDAVECPPTFGTEPRSIRGIIAGGEKAMFAAQEGVEDKEAAGSKDMEILSVNERDVVCGIAASLRTPFVMGAIKTAKERGCHTIYLTTNPREQFDSPAFHELSKAIDVKICPEVGPEVIMGSTRMKSGTAQKMVLNMISTTAMIRLGKVYENMMIDLQTTNMKLKERAKRIIMTITGIGYDDAADFLEKAQGHVKTALVMIKTGSSFEEASLRLSKAGGFVRLAIDKNIPTSI
jgi:N-acetylmuramic acid 6-phosphate etherase